MYLFPQRRNARVRLLAAFLTTLPLLTATVSHTAAQVPRKINYQGKLTDMRGVPVPDGNYDMRFSLYDAETGGVLLWGPEDWTASTTQVPVNEGLFNVMLGSHTSLTSIPFDTTYWLEVEVYNDIRTAWEPFLPREQLASAPYALRASGVVDGAITESAIAASGLSAGKITSGTFENVRINWAAPGAIGSTAPSTGHFSTLTTTGSVGIGTTTPSAALDVRSGNALFASSTGIFLSLDTSATIYGYDGSTYNDLVLKTHAGPQLYLKTNGNVGIGTDDPQALLHAVSTASTAKSIYGEASGFYAYGVYGTSNNNSGYGVYGQSAGEGGYGVYGEASGTNGRGGEFNGALYGVYVLGPKNYFSGNVGIGTVSPQAPLHVLTSTSNEKAIYGESTASGGYGVYGEASGTNGRGGEFVGNLYGVYVVGPKNHFGGDVGIGTVSPQEKLHVYSSTSNEGILVSGSGNKKIEVDAGDSALLYLDRAATGDEAKIRFETAGTGYVALGLDNDGTNNLHIGTSGLGTKWLTVETSGDVGIGTASPSYKLHVNGTAYASGAAGALSDYRHKTNIRDLSLDAVEIVKGLRPVTFEWKKPLDSGMEGEQLGFIAQEVEEILPEVVLTQDDEEKTKGLKYNELIPLLTSAFQEFIQEVTEENAGLKAAIQEQQTRIEVLESQLKAVE